MYHTKVKQKEESFFQNISIKLLARCFDVKKFFRKSKMAAIKTLTDTNGILKERILQSQCYQYTKQPYLSTNKQSGSTSVPGYILKYLAM